MQDCLLQLACRKKDTHCNQARVHRVFSRMVTPRTVSSEKTAYVDFCNF